MANVAVYGGRPLTGEVMPSANKNAVLPILCASLLTDQEVVLKGVPDLTDVRKILDFFVELGSEVHADWRSGELRLRHGRGLDAERAQLPSGMRAAVLLIPGLLCRFGRASILGDPKGCTLGVREIDPHIEIFRLFGAVAAHDGEAIVLRAPRGLAAANHWLDYASVTATENFLMCAAVCAGRSVLVNGASEPHVQELAAFLFALGAEVSSEPGGGLAVTGAPGRLNGATHRFEEDHHEIATFLALGAVTGGEVRVRNRAPERFGLIDGAFAKFGVEVCHQDGWSSAAAPRRLQVRKPFTAHLMQKIEAAPWPYLPADLLPIFIALGACASGSALYWNKVYEGALGWTSELAKFGVQATLCDPHRVIVTGGGRLAPAEVESPYIIRVAIALLMIAARIEGRSRIRGADPIRRAHPGFLENLRGLGADMEWETSA
jgi:UDP-N-acetylglucosamine 1-carboxyvinyltransferase